MDNKQPIWAKMQPAKGRKMTKIDTTRRNAIELLKIAAEAASAALDAKCELFFEDGRFGAFRAIDKMEPLPNGIQEAIDYYITAVHQYYLARDGEFGFIGRRTELSEKHLVAALKQTYENVSLRDGLKPTREMSAMFYSGASSAAILMGASRKTHDALVNMALAALD